MAAKGKTIKDYWWHFRVLSLYLKLDHDDCRERMIAYFQGLPGVNDAEAARIKVNDWWNGERTPQTEKSRTPVKEFFSALVAELPKERKLPKNKSIVWKDEWLERTEDDLKENEPILRDAVKKFDEPFAIARKLRECYRNSGLLKDIVDHYCHKCFFIYRIHTASNKLVRDVLRIQGHDEEKIFCKYYQYTSHKPTYPEWKNIKVFRGNVFFNSASLDINFVSETYNNHSGPQYGNIVFPPLGENTGRVGLLMALKDEDHFPAASAIFVMEAESRTYPEIFKDMPRYVRPLSEKDKDIEDYFGILDKLEKKMIEAEQSPKAK